MTLMKKKKYRTEAITRDRCDFTNVVAKENDNKANNESRQTNCDNQIDCQMEKNIEKPRCSRDSLWTP